VPIFHCLGTELLLQLGFKGGMDSSRGDYHAGLREHINKAASQIGPSAENLAKSIIDYRRQYFGDASQILDLGISDAEL
jgi:hypothetical protein